MSVQNEKNSTSQRPVDIGGQAVLEGVMMKGPKAYAIAVRRPNGDIVVALIENEATVKVFYRENGHYRLQPRNRTMMPIIVSRLSILGKVAASVRYY